MGAVLEEVDMATYERIWDGTAKNFAPKTVSLGGGIFFISGRENQKEPLLTRIGRCYDE